MAIRHASDADISELLPLLRGYCDFYGASPPDDGLTAMARAVIGAANDEAFLLVAEDGDELVGFAACDWKWSSLRGARIVVLEDLYVRPESRGEGHADALIAAAGTLGRRYGAPIMTWLTQSENERARTVYERVGGHSETYLEYELEL